MFKHLSSKIGLMAAATLAPGIALADELNSGDTAWMLTATALVLFMTIPGLSLFYAGLVRSKNVLSVLGQCFAITAVITIVWMVAGYSMAFSDGGSMQQWVGGLSNAFLSGITVDSLSGTIPETVFMTFQMTFAIITPALIVGAYAERMKFSAMLIFSILWVLLVYAPICHWVWGGGWIADRGAIDFAGGTVVHINAGIAGLVAAIMLGKRKGYPTTAMPPHNLGMSVIGASMLWVGWFGFNAGSQLAADGTAGMAMAVTQIATATAAVTWMLIEWMVHGKPSVLGIITGAVAGLVAITPASGTVAPVGALVIGFGGAAGAFFGATALKKMLGYDDALDVWGVHGVAGIVGALLTGIFTAETFGGTGLAEGVSMMEQLYIQAEGIVATLVYGGVATFVILLILKLIIGLRVDEESEVEGLDLSQHDERGYIL